MRAYTIQQVSKDMNVPPGTIRQWEKDLNGLIVIPRTKQGSRFYTETEINILQKVKSMRDKNLSKIMIRDLLQKHLHNDSEAPSETLETTIPVLSERVEIPTPTGLVESNKTLDSEEFYQAMELYTHKLVKSLNEEIRHTIRKEITEEVKKEISKNSLHTVKCLSDSIYKSTEKTKAEIQDLSHTVLEASERTSETFETLSKSITNVSEASSERISSLSERVSKSTAATTNELKSLSQYISLSTEVTNNEITNLTETLNKDREVFIETINAERDLHHVEILQREKAFLDLVANFRQTASTKNPQKWWKFW